MVVLSLCPIQEQNIFHKIVCFYLDGDVTAIKDVEGADGGIPVENNKEDGTNDSDGYIDVDTDDCSDTASISSGASTGSTGELLHGAVAQLCKCWVFFPVVQKIIAILAMSRVFASVFYSY